MYQVGMRGDDLKQAAMFSYITLARRIPADHPARQIRCAGRPGAGADGWGVGGVVLGDGPAVDCSGTAFAGYAFDGVVFHPQRTAADGTDELQPAVSLVRGPGDGRRGVGRD